MVSDMCVSKPIKSIQFLAIQILIIRINIQISNESNDDLLFNSAREYLYIFYKLFQFQDLFVSFPVSIRIQDSLQHCNVFEKA